MAVRAKTIFLWLFASLISGCTTTAGEPKEGRKDISQDYCPNNNIDLNTSTLFGHKSALCDRAGNLWLAPYGGGLLRYDGRRYTSFTCRQGFVDGTVLSMLEDKNGNLWFGTSGNGVSRYDVSLAGNPCNKNICRHNLQMDQELQEHDQEVAKAFTNFTTAQGLTNNSVLSMAEDKNGDLLFGTAGGGVSHYDGQSFTTEELPNNFVYSMLKDRQGNLWFGTAGGGVICYDGATYNRYSTAQGLANDFVLSIAEDKNGAIWFGTSGGGVSRYDARPDRRVSFTNYTTAQGLANNSVLSIKEDRVGNLWFGTSGGGVSRYDGRSLMTLPVLSENYVYSITEDKSGNLWFGTSCGGLLRYDGKSISYLTPPGADTSSQAGSKILCRLRDRAGRLWVGTGNHGVCRYNNRGGYIYFTRKEGLTSNIVRDIIEDKAGNIWFATSGGVCCYHTSPSFMKETESAGSRFTSLTLIDGRGYSDNGVWTALEDRAGRLWFGVAGMVCRYEVPKVAEGDLNITGDRFTNFPIPGTDENCPSQVWCSFEDKAGNLWFGTSGSGVYRYNADLNDTTGNGISPPKSGPEFVQFTDKDGLSSNFVTNIKQDKAGKLWFGTMEGGLCRYEPRANTEKGGLLVRN